MKRPISRAIVTASLMFSLVNVTVGMQQAVPDSNRPIRLVVRVSWTSPNGNSPKELLEDVRIAVTKRLQKEKVYEVLTSTDKALDYSLVIKYVATGFGEVGYKATLTSRNGKSLLMSQGSTVVSRGDNGRYTIYNFVQPVMRVNADGSRSPNPDIADMVKSAIETLSSRQR